MIIDGKKLAEEIKISLAKDISKLGKKLRLAVVRVGENLVTKKFLEQKRKFGEAIGIDVRMYSLPENISTNALRKKLAEIVHIKQNSYIIVQLPLPKQVHAQYILDGIVPEKDPDMLSSKSVGAFAAGRSPIVPPIVGAVKHIFEKYEVALRRKHAVVVGAGRLVGKPLALWLLRQSCVLTILDEHAPNVDRWTQMADVVISGTGVPGLIKPEMVKDGAVVIDCGTAESREDGRLVGDVNPAVAAKTSLFATVPGGIGPLTVAMLFSNIVTLAKKIKHL